MYYYVRRILKRLQVPLPYESGFNATDNAYSSEGVYKVCVRTMKFLMIL